MYKDQKYIVNNFDKTQNIHRPSPASNIVENSKINLSKMQM